MTRNDLEVARRKKKREQLNKSGASKGNGDEGADAQLDAILRQILNPDAYDRVSNVKVVKGPTFYKLVAQQIVMYYNKYRLKLSDDTVKQILSSVSTQVHKDYKIKFVRK